MYPLCKTDIDSFVHASCESGDRVMVDQSSFSADLHAVMLRHHCSEYGCLGEKVGQVKCGSSLPVKRGGTGVNRHILPFLWLFCCFALCQAYHT